MNNPTDYMKRFFEEKEIAFKLYEIEDKNGFTHIFDTTVLIDRMLNTSIKEQQQIAKILRKIDFKNGSVQHFLNYLAQAMVKKWSKEAA